MSEFFIGYYKRADDRLTWHVATAIRTPQKPLSQDDIKALCGHGGSWVTRLGPKITWTPYRGDDARDMLATLQASCDTKRGDKACGSCWHEVVESISAVDRLAELA